MAKTKKNIKVRDLKPNKDAKGGFGKVAGNPVVSGVIAGGTNADRGQVIDTNQSTN